MSKERASFNLYFDSLDAFEHLTDTEFRAVFNAIVEYEKDGSESLTGVLKAVFTPFKNNTDRAKDKYAETCRKNKEIADKRWNKESTKSTTGKTGTSKVPESTKSTDKDKDKDKDKDIKEEEGDWSFINECKTKYCGVQFTIDKVQYFFRDDGLLATWNKGRAVTAPKALMLYKRMNENQDAVLYHLNHNKKKD